MIGNDDDVTNSNESVDIGDIDSKCDVISSQFSDEMNDLIENLSDPAPANLVNAPFNVPPSVQ